MLSGLDVCKASLFVGYMGERGFILWSGCFFTQLLMVLLVGGKSDVAALQFHALVYNERNL